MNIEEYVTESISQIINAVCAARKHADGKDAIVCPQDSEYTIPIKDVEFDIATTIVEDENKLGGGSIQVFGIKFGGDVATSATATSVSRIKFTIPLAFPDPTVKRDSGRPVALSNPVLG